MDQLKAYGHDLEVLAVAVEQCDAWKYVEISGLEMGVIRLINFDYVTKRFEYRQAGHRYQLPLPNMIHDATQRLIEAVRRIVEPA